MVLIKHLLSGQAEGKRPRGAACTKGWCCSNAAAGSAGEGEQQKGSGAPNTCGSHEKDTRMVSDGWSRAAPKSLDGYLSVQAFPNISTSPLQPSHLQQKHRNTCFRRWLQLITDHPSLPAMPGQNWIRIRFCKADFKSHSMDLSFKIPKSHI